MCIFIATYNLFVYGVVFTLPGEAAHLCSFECTHSYSVYLYDATQWIKALSWAGWLKFMYMMLNCLLLSVPVHMLIWKLIDRYTDTSTLYSIKRQHKFAEISHTISILKNYVASSLHWRLNISGFRVLVIETIKKNCKIGGKKENHNHAAADLMSRISVVSSTKDLLTTVVLSADWVPL